MPRLLLALPLLLTAAALADAPTTQPLVLAPSAQPISRASTADELAATDEISTILGPVHIAIEATTLPAFGSANVYLRLDPLPNAARNPPPVPHGFPLTLRLSSPDMPHPSAPLNIGPDAPFNQPVFCVARITLGPPGDYTLELLDRNLVIASAHLTATHDQAQRWQPLLGRGKSTLDPEPAVPIIDGTLPTTAIPTGPLPSAAPPTTPDPRFLLSVKGNTFTIKNWPAANFFPEQQLLAAFYINGKRFTPEIPAHFQDALAPDRFELNNSPGAYTFTLTLDPATLGAKPTDHLEMELLCSPYGFQKLSLNKTLHGSDLDPLLLSNRIAISTLTP